MKKSPNKALGRAVVVSMRVFADLAARWFREGNGDCAAARTRRGALVVVAIDECADSIEGFLLRERLLEDVQPDKDEHIAAGATARTVSKRSEVVDRLAGNRHVRSDAPTALETVTGSGGVCGVHGNFVGRACPTCVTGGNIPTNQTVRA